MIDTIVPKSYETEDLKQDLVLFYWENSEKLDTSKVTLYYSLKNKLIDLVRHYGSSKYIFPVVENIDLFMDKYIDCELLKKAEILLEFEMPNNARKVLELACENYNQKEIADEMECTKQYIGQIVKEILIPMAVMI